MNANLRVLTLHDVELIRQWRNQDLSPWRTPHLITEEMQRDFYKNVVCDRNSPHRFWAVEEEGAPWHSPAGMVGLTNIQWENRLAEVNLILSPSDMGLADKAVDLILEQAFDFLNLETVCGEYYLCSSMFAIWDDIVSRWMEAYQGYGVYRTILRRRKFWKGEFHDSLYFSISREAYGEYQALKRFEEHRERNEANG